MVTYTVTFHNMSIHLIIEVSNTLEHALYASLMIRTVYIISNISIQLLLLRKYRIPYDILGILSTMLWGWLPRFPNCQSATLHFIGIRTIERCLWENNALSDHALGDVEGVSDRVEVHAAFLEVGKLHDRKTQESKNFVQNRDQQSELSITSSSSGSQTLEPFLQPHNPIPSHRVPHIIFQAPHIIEGHTRVHLVFSKYQWGWQKSLWPAPLTRGKSEDGKNCQVKVGKYDISYRAKLEDRKMSMDLSSWSSDISPCG